MRKTYFQKVFLFTFPLFVVSSIYKRIGFQMFLFGTTRLLLDQSRAPGRKLYLQLLYGTRYGRFLAFYVTSHDRIILRTR